MTSWILEALDDNKLIEAQTEASRRLLKNAFELPADAEISSNYIESDYNLRFISSSFELAVIDLLDKEDQLITLREISSQAFQILRTIPVSDDPLEAAKTYLRLACFGILGERGTDVARLLKESPWPELPILSQVWGERTFVTILDVWLRLMRKDGWEDLDTVQERVLNLREQQQNFEEKYLQNQGQYARYEAWRLVALYHLAKAAELQAIFTTNGNIDGNYDIRQQLEAQFDRALIACSRAELVELETLIHLLAGAARQLIDNSIWTITRAVNPSVTEFVESIVSRSKRPIFEMLPPQRLTLSEEGLLGSSYRSVVVNLPTSSGKTFIAMFRILQALNQFDREKGWVAYLAPTRALVNQICAELRKNFSPLNINVERVSPALEIDGSEASILSDTGESTQFRILVTTPEKLDLMLRSGWEEKIDRPLTLVVVDEAHNIGQKKRGIKLELLLATINRECRNAQFLLLTPFVKNASEIAKWLEPVNSKDIQLSINWQPNDRAIVLTQPKKGNRRGEFSLCLETLHTNKNTLHIPENLFLEYNRPLGFSWSEVKNNISKIAAATAEIMKIRGPVIILAGAPHYTWNIAKYFMKDTNKLCEVHEDIRLVQRYLQYEFGENFLLCELLEFGVAVHHSGLSDESKRLIEWLFERGHIKVLVATTTIAQGVNFPVSGVVLAAHQYLLDEYPFREDIPPEDFWNLAGRAGRANQGSVGIVALVSPNEERAVILREFVGKQVGSLNSTLIDMVQDVLKNGKCLELHTLFYEPEWSAFLQYLVHTYRQIDDSSRFFNEIEHVLRGTFGFQNLRRSNNQLANLLLVAVKDYCERFPSKPLKLVDSTGFSLESVLHTLKTLSNNRITEDIWNPDSLFSDRRDLQKLMGILLEVPELRKNLEAATGGHGKDGDLLASIVHDWVNGVTIEEISKAYFNEDNNGNEVDPTIAITNCCKNLFGKLTQTSAWGLSALQTMTFKDKFDDMPESEKQILLNLPARVFYGVNSDEAIAMRLLGVPREASQPLAQVLAEEIHGKKLNELREVLKNSDSSVWSKAMSNRGDDYFRIWKILEGIEL